MTDIVCTPSRPSLVRCVEPPTSKPVNIDRAKRLGRIDASAEDDTVEEFIEVAVAMLDGWDGRLNPKRCLCPQTWEAVFDGFQAEIKLPLVPVISIESITYLDGDGAEQEVSPTDGYLLVGDNWSATLSATRGETWPSTLSGAATVTVRFVAGYASVPAALAQDVATLVAFWFDNRDKIGQFPAGWVSAYKRPVYA